MFNEPASGQKLNLSSNNLAKQHTVVETSKASIKFQGICGKVQGLWDQFEEKRLVI
jgi:hypothetical protein